MKHTATLNKMKDFSGSNSKDDVSTQLNHIITKGLIVFRH